MAQTTLTDEEFGERYPDRRETLTADERLLLMSETQQIIRTYGWQSAAARLMALALVPAFLYIGSAGPSLWQVAPVLCLFLLWLWDGHWQELRVRYIIIFHDVVHSSRKPDLGLQTYETLNVGALWRPVQAIIYIPLIVLFALIGLR